MFKMGVRLGLMLTNPATSVSPFPVQEARFRYLSEDEIPAILEACEKQVTSPWLYPLVVLALNTGARQGELLKLRYEDIDLERGLIYFGRTKNRKLKTVPMNKAVKEAGNGFQSIYSRQRTANDTKITHVDECFVLGVKSMKVWGCVHRHHGKYKVKRFSCWDQFLSMVFAQWASLAFSGGNNATHLQELKM
jgi:site-specific recombinase XerD